MKTKMIATKQESSLTTKCLDFIEFNIIEGIFPPGQKLKMEFLKEQLHAGQSPIREALSRLTESGLVEAEENKGFRVAKVSEEDVRDIYEVMFNIDILALELAMQRGDDVWEALILGALHQLGRVENDPQGVSYAVWVKRNLAFHEALISGCKSPTLLYLRALVYKRFDRYCRMAFHAAEDALHLNHEEHKKIAEAVIARDKETVRTLMHQHLIGSMEDTILTLKASKII